MQQKKSMNIFWVDFLHFHDKLLSFNSERLQKVQTLIKNLPDTHELNSRVAKSEKDIEEAMSILNGIRQRDLLNQNTGVDTNMEFDSVIRDLTVGSSDLMIMTAEKAHQLQFNSPRNEPIDGMNEIVHFLKVPSETHKASRKVMKECLSSIYGRDTQWAIDYPEPVAVCFGYSDYRYLSSSKLVCIPPNEATQLCRWPTLVHETMHSKLDDITLNKHIIESPESRSVPSIKRSIAQLERIQPNWREIAKDIDDLSDLFDNMLKLNTGEGYREAYSWIWEDDFYLPFAFAHDQFFEILCDIASVKLVGPASVFVLGSSAANHCRNPELDTKEHLLNPSHPPDSVRLLYAFEVLRNIGTDSNITDFLEVQIKGLVGADINEREFSTEENLANYLVNSYVEIVFELLPELEQLVDAIVAEKSSSYDSNKMSKTLKSFEEVSNGKSFSNQELGSFDFMNMAWLKVIDIFKRVDNSSGSFGEFSKLRKEEEDEEKGFFGRLWKAFVSP